MATWKTPKAILEQGLILTNQMRDQQDAFVQLVAITTDGIIANVGQIRVATTKQIRSGFTKEVFHAIRDKERSRQR